MVTLALNLKHSYSIFFFDNLSEPDNGTYPRT